MKFNAVKEREAKLSPKSPGGGWLAAKVTVSPVPTPTVGVGVGEVVVVGPPPVVTASEEYLACEIGPKYPTAGETPFPACHEATAAFVFEP